MKKINNKKTFIDLFSGIGGLRIPFDLLGWKCVFSSDIDRNACETYQLNFKHDSYNDITKINYNLIPDHNLLLGGFPCQAFSVAGYRKGFLDERGTLIFNILEIIKNKTPKLILLENVRNLITHNNGETFKIIIENITKLGYDVQWHLLNLLNFGIPQNRERVYIIGILKGKQVYKMEINKKKLENISKFVDFNKKVDQKFYYHNTKYEKMLDECWDKESIFYQIRRKYIRKNKNNVCPTLTANMGMGGHNVPIIKAKHGWRKLTPRECFNLMGFPIKYKLPNIANSHLYKQAGNSVGVPVIKELANNIDGIFNNENR